jgi:beta-glucosidase
MRMKFHSALLFLVIAASFVRAASAQQACYSQLSPAQVDARIDAMIAQMTIAERVAQLQDRAPAVPRLGIPAYNWWNEGLHGLARDGYATVFPQAVGLAATWDTSLLREIGDVVSTEARAKFNLHGRADTPRYGGLTVWSPNINIFRDPRWGRGQETYGEDPFLTASLGSEFVRGVQGDDRFYLKADATPKHFVAHSGPEKGRDSFNARVSEHDLADTYLPAFHAVIADGHAAALMCSYNGINGVPSCANTALLDDLVRKRWGFAGYVVSDCDAVGNLASYQHFSADSAHGAAAALNAGVDLDCGTTYSALNESYAQKMITQPTLNRALHRLLLARVRLGMLDPSNCTPYDAIGADQLDSESHRMSALRAAEESIVLLRNRSLLPLRKDTGRIAVIGPTADMMKVLEANYHGTASHPVTPLEGLSAAFPHVIYAQGSLLADGISQPIPRTAWRTAPAQDSPSGLHAEYFNTAAFSGAPAQSTTVAKIDLDLDRVGPSPEIHAQHYAARWSGYLAPPAAGDYLLRVNVERCWDCTEHDSYRLYVDGKLVLDNHGGKNDPEQFQLHAADRSAHVVRLELLHTGDDEGIALEWIPPATALLDEALAAAAQSDVIVACLGLSPDLEGEALQTHLEGFDSGDRTSLDLPEAQRALLARLGTLHKPLVVVLTSGSAVALGPEAGNADAILEAWYPGEEGGTALAHILSGRTNPSGRLPVTFYRSVADLPDFSDYSMKNRTYRYFAGPVQFPFGFGLSYSTFVYSPIQLSARTLSARDPLTVRVKVRNSSSVAGTEVAELYLAPLDLPGAPRLALRDFARVNLAPGETRELTFTLDESKLSFVDEKGERRVRSGAYTVFVGSTQPSLNKSTGSAFRIAGDTSRR